MSETVGIAAEASSYSGVWIDSRKDLPQEGETVLVMTSDYILGFGYINEGNWEVSLPPWETSGGDGAEVLFWTKYPPPPSAV